MSIPVLTSIKRRLGSLRRSPAIRAGAALEALGTCSTARQFHKVWKMIHHDLATYREVEARITRAQQARLGSLAGRFGIPAGWTHIGGVKEKVSKFCPACLAPVLLL